VCVWDNVRSPASRAPPGYTRLRDAVAHAQARGARPLGEGAHDDQVGVGAGVEGRRGASPAQRNSALGLIVDDDDGGERAELRRVAAHGSLCARARGGGPSTHTPATSCRASACRRSGCWGRRKDHAGAGGHGRSDALEVQRELGGGPAVDVDDAAA